MDANEQNAFIRFLADELKNHSRELMAYKLFALQLRKAGYVGVDELLSQARKSPELQALFEKHFEGFDAFIRQPAPISRRK